SHFGLKQGRAGRSREGLPWAAGARGPRPTGPRTRRTWRPTRRCFAKARRCTCSTARPRGARRSAAVLDPRHGAYRPRSGLSDTGGYPEWPADYYAQSSSSPGVLIEYRWPHFFTARGNLVDSDGDYSEIYPERDVTAAGEPPPGPRPWAGLVPHGSEPELAILTFRWG
ncbi:unnamed protein product, partial [Prorocentrum cordatum]